MCIKRCCFVSFYYNYGVHLFTSSVSESTFLSYAAKKRRRRRLSLSHSKPPKLSFEPLLLSPLSNERGASILHNNNNNNNSNNKAASLHFFGEGGASWRDSAGPAQTAKSFYVNFLFISSFN